MIERFISFAGSCVVVRYEGEVAQQIVTFLFQHIPTYNDVLPHETINLESGKKTNLIQLTHNGDVIYVGKSAAIAAERLMGHVIYHLANKSQGGLLFHAAGLVWKDKGVLIPGKIGAGKTTITAWLLNKGLGYLTDEVVFIPDGQMSMEVFRRPLNVKNGAFPVVEQFLERCEDRSQIWTTLEGKLIPPELFNVIPVSVFSGYPLRLILFPEYIRREEGEIRSLTKAQTSLFLMKNLINARNLPGDGLPECTRLAQNVPAFHCQYEDFSQIETFIIEQLIELA